MDSWTSHLQDAAGSNSADDWEDWLRWDPSTENMSPGSSTKESGPLTDAEDSFAWLQPDKTVDPTLVVGDSVLDFNDPAQPYVFGSDEAASAHIPFDAQKVSAPHWPSIEIEHPSPPESRQDSLSSNSSVARYRRISASTINTGMLDSQQHSPDSHTHSSSALSSLSPQATAPPKKKPGRKRKSVASGDSSVDGEPPVKKTSHNVIEKRYRNNLNDKILELRDSVPSLRVTSKPNGEEDGSEDLEGLTPAHKLNKSTIMAKATEYIRHLEKRNKSMSDDLDALKRRLRALEQAQSRNSALPDATAGVRPRHTSTTHASAMDLDVSHSMPFATSIDEFGIHRRQSDDEQSGSNGNGFMSKLMMGSMAGLMTMESFLEHDQSGQDPSSRGLSAAPLDLVRRAFSGSNGGSPASLASHSYLPLVKISLILVCLAYLLRPLFHARPNRKAASIPHITLTAAPSLASPVETRRKAWLTAIQTVWTPRPFLLEVVAVTVRMIELSLRRIIGFDRYAELLGMSKDQEAARIKAWDIAIDAQLAGGDAEVSYYRLLLTLMASGTLPDSPIRLMQKAVHFRIFFWEIANAGYGNLFMFKTFTAKVARVYWNSARKQQRALASGNASKVDDLDRTIELLPDHLAALIELECDEVLTDDIIQRAYNLAWNRPSAEKTTSNAILDKVVEDPSIRSPVDAVAAWFTNTIIDEALALSVRDKDTTATELVNIAALTAPPASSTLTRACVVKSILSPEDRESSIASALESMPQSSSASHELGRSPTTVHLDVVRHVPLTAEVRTGLTLAKLLSMCDGKNPADSKLRAAKVLERIASRATQFSLLTAVATYKVLDVYASDPNLFTQSNAGFEQLACNLRLWLSTRAGRAIGLDSAEKGCIVERCLAVTKSTGGWRVKDDADSGYGSGLSRRSSQEMALS